MNEEIQKNDKNNGNIVKTVIIVLLVIALLLCIGFVIYDKVISKDNDTTNTGNNNSNNTNDVVTLDINSDLVKNLVYPYEEIDTRYTNFYAVNLVDFNVETTDMGLFRDAALYKVPSAEVVSNVDVNKDSHAKDLEEKGLIWSMCEGCYSYTTPAAMKKAFAKIFGPDIEYTDGQGVKTSRNFYYDSTSPRYWTDLMNYDGPIGYGSKIYKAEQKGDEIYVYIAAYLVRDDYADYIYQYSSNFTLDDLDKDTALASYDEAYTDQQTYEAGFNKIVDQLISENKLNTYKFTFKKQSDGKYYVYSGEWM
ncbi:MAG: hypothetical protein NC181_04665 [Clostridium sp.]|nr:hypothetical protein [Clostridium sp.]